MRVRWSGRWLTPASRRCCVLRGMLVVFPGGSGSPTILPTNWASAAGHPGTLDD